MPEAPKPPEQPIEKPSPEALEELLPPKEVPEEEPTQPPEQPAPEEELPWGLRRLTWVRGKPLNALLRTQKHLEKAISHINIEVDTLKARLEGLTKEMEEKPRPGLQVRLEWAKGKLEEKSRELRAIVEEVGEGKVFDAALEIIRLALRRDLCAALEQHGVDLKELEELKYEFAKERKCVLKNLKDALTVKITGAWQKIASLTMNLEIDPIGCKDAFIKVSDDLSDLQRRNSTEVSLGHAVLFQITRAFDEQIDVERSKRDAAKSGAGSPLRQVVLLLLVCKMQESTVEGSDQQKALS